MSEQVATEAEQGRAQELGAAAPAEEGDKKYLEDQKERRERERERERESKVTCERQRGEEEERGREGDTRFKR